ncbi:MAG: hypothetical protein QOJ35_4090 [Solirubrobacteraceae bacterium]|nr:hypothetical protein [Solirubrobacteraceae bacterium]
MSTPGDGRRWEAPALAALAVAALVGFFVYPTYSNYDSLYSLLWGRELLHGMLPSFEAYRAPTQHPLWVAICVPLAAFGGAGDRALLGLCVLSFVALVAAMYRLGRETFGSVVGLVAALLLLSRLDFPFFAARGYVDIPYLALVLWAAALEAARPKRGGAVWVLLTLAGLLRPEAWLLAGVYGLWMAWGKPPGVWLRAGAIVAVAPVVWALSDLAVTGDPLYSLNYTTESAATLGRRQSLSELPGVTLRYLAELTKPPVFVAALAGIVLAWRIARERVLVPATLLVWGVGTFLLVSLRGFSVINRYVLVAALALMLFAAVAIAGFSRLPRGHRAVRPWAAGSLLVVLAGIVYTALTFNPRYVDRELRLRGQVRHDLTSVLGSARVRAGRACGPISVPNHKLVADVRWLTDSGADGVVARSDPAQIARERRGGVGLYVIGGTRFLKHPAYGPFDQTQDSPSIQVPPPGFRRATVGRYFSAYVRC